MATNLFEELKHRKEKVLALVAKGLEYEWITPERAKEIEDKIESDTLTIGVIGQMKCGKSTFLNSFVFGDTVLPAATTPMTAALSVITYGEQKKIKAEFYTSDEWAEQQLQAGRSLEDAQGNAAEESKIKAAKELVSKAHKLGSQLQTLLGQSQEDTFDNLIEYVGAEGKYIAITKSVTIYYPKDYLKGVEIVDTPGFNDPIVSREERTKDFLKRADVVLVMLYAGRPFDATDRDIIFKNVRQCGIGKVLIGINKYDMPYCGENQEKEEQIKEYVINEIRKASRECGDNTLSEILSETTPIPLSAEMALLSMLPMSKIANISALNFAWKRYCDGFGISTQAEMSKWSHIDDMTSAIKRLISTEKEKILFAKPINAIIATGNTLLSETEANINKLKSLIDKLQMPDDELEEVDEKLNKAHRRISKKIDSLGEDIESELRNVIRKGKDQLEDDVDAACRNMRSIVDNEWGKFTNFASKVKPRLDAEFDKLSTRTLKRSVLSITEDAKRTIDRSVSDFFEDIEDTLMRYLPDFDSRAFVKKVKNGTVLEVTNKELFMVDESNTEEEHNLIDYIGDFLDGASWGLLGKIGGILNHSSDKAEVLNTINNIASQFDPTPYLEAAMTQREEIIEKVRKTFIEQLIEPLKKQIAEIKEQKGNKQASLQSAQTKLQEEESKKKLLEEQLATISEIKEEITQ